MSASKDENNCKSFSNNGETITGNSNIAEQFCNYFSSIASDLASKVQTPTSGRFTDYLNPQPQKSAFFSPTSPQEIEHLCQGLDPSKGPGHDGLAPKIFHLMAYELSLPLSKLINICLETGYFSNLKWPV